jgi:hypothetical protein
MNYEPYIETASGKKLYFLNPDPDQIDIRDIALSLSRVPRFNGHTSKLLTVAEHSWAGARYIPDEYKLSFLLHDAAEAYLCDIPSPVKQHLPEYQKMEEGLQACIEEKFGVNLHSSMVKYYDLTMLSNEAWHLVKSRGEDWDIWKTIKRPAVTAEFRPLCLEPEVARVVFLELFYELYRNSTPTREAKAA